MRARVCGCHFSLVTMVICGNLYLPIFFRFIYCILSGRNKVVVVVPVRVEL